MAELAKATIYIQDESAYTSGVDTLIPLFVFATEQDKVVDELEQQKHLQMKFQL